MVDKVIVDRKSVRVFSKLRPLRLCDAWLLPFLQEQNIGHNICSGIRFERIVRQANCAQQLGALGNIPSGAVILAVHRVARGHKRHDTARTHLIERLGKKVIVDGKTELVVSSVVYLILSERHIADGKVIEISPVRRFKSGNGDICLRIELLCNPAGDAVQFHAVELAALHLLR